MRGFLSGICCVLGVLSARSKPSKQVQRSFVDPLKHDILIITPKNFDASVNKYRDRFPGAILFYNEVTEAHEHIEQVWDPLAKQLRGMMKIGALSCTQFPQFCEAQSVTIDNATAVRIYPPLPMPAYQYQGKFEQTKLASTLMKLIPPAKVDVLKEDKDLAAFLGQSPAIPKVFLFTPKDKPSALFTSLAHSFSDRMNFGIVVSQLDSELSKKFKVRKLPSLLIKKGDMTMSLRGVQMYKGALNFHDLHEWINVHSETFVKGGGFITESEPTAEDISIMRPWLLHKVPELTKGSHHEVCFKKPNGLCAIYVKHGPITDAEKEMLEKLSDEYSPDGKIAFHWSWLDVDLETNYAKLLKMEPQEDSDATVSESPSFVIFNPHKKLRFSKLSNELKADIKTIAAFVQKIISGDGRFNIIKGNRIPAFIVRKKKDGDKPVADKEAPRPTASAGKNEEL